jgi:hypothetical protein
MPIDLSHQDDRVTADYGTHMWELKTVDSEGELYFDYEADDAQLYVFSPPKGADKKWVEVSETNAARIERALEACAAFLGKDGTKVQINQLDLSAKFSDEEAVDLLNRQFEAVARKHGIKMKVKPTIIDDRSLRVLQGPLRLRLAYAWKRLVAKLCGRK